MDNDEKTGKLLKSITQLTPEEGAKKVYASMDDEKFAKYLQGLRAKAEEKSIAQTPVKEALERSRTGSALSSYKDWASGAPTTQEQSKAFYERLAQEAAKDDVVRDIDLNKYRTQNALDESRLARDASQFKTLADSETKLARKEALKRMLGVAGKGLSVAGKIAAPVGAIMGLYGDDLAPEGEEFEIPRKSRK